MSENSEFSPKQRIYLDWLAISRYERKPPTEQLLARQLHITDRTLRRWKQQAGFRNEINRRARELVKFDLPEVYAALRREAIKGSFYHIKLILEMVGEHTDRLDVNISNVSDSDISREFSALLNAARERAGRSTQSGD